MSAKGQDSSIAASPSPLGTSVYPVQDLGKGLGARCEAEITRSGKTVTELRQPNFVTHSLVVRRPISPKEYQGEEQRESKSQAPSGSQPVKPVALDSQDPHVSSSIGQRADYQEPGDLEFRKNLKRLNDARVAPLNQSYPGIDALGTLAGIEDLKRANLLRKEGLMSNPSSQDIYGYASNQNLRAVMHPGKGLGSLVRSSTAARIEDF